jgi:hypothetical protein
MENENVEVVEDSVNVEPEEVKEDDTLVCTPNQIGCAAAVAVGIGALIGIGAYTGAKKLYALHKDKVANGVDIVSKLKTKFGKHNQNHEETEKVEPEVI